MTVGHRGGAPHPRRQRRLQDRARSGCPDSAWRQALGGSGHRRGAPTQWGRALQGTRDGGVLVGAAPVAVTDHAASSTCWTVLRSPPPCTRAHTHSHSHTPTHTTHKRRHTQHALVTECWDGSFAFPRLPACSVVHVIVNYAYRSC